MKIPKEIRITWLATSVVVDFIAAAFLMLLLGSLGIQWGYWHAWWVTFLGTFVASSVIWPVVARIEYLIEHQQ